MPATLRSRTRSSKPDLDSIVLKGVRTHNLKNLDLSIPKGRLIVFTGVSGSGKSSLAFDTLYAEGQRRYVESLSAYARQFLERMEKPDMDSVTGILPSIAIEAKNVISNARSTVGTQTEVNDYLRVIFARIGKTFCHSCGRQVEPDTPAAVFVSLKKKGEGKFADIFFKVTWGKKGAKYLKDFTAELTRQGFLKVEHGGKILDLESETTLRFLEGADSVKVLADRVRVEESEKKRFFESLESAYRHGHGKCEVALEGGDAHFFSEDFHCAPCDLEFKRPTPNTFSFNSPLGACPTCQGFGRIIRLDPHLVVPNESKTLEDGAIEPWTKPSCAREFKQLKSFCRRRGIPLDRPWKDLDEEDREIIFKGTKGYFGVEEFFAYLEKKTYKMHVRVFLARYRTYTPCSACHGARLRPEALRVKWEGETIQSLSEKTLEDLQHFVDHAVLTPHEEALIGPVLLEFKNRLRFLNDVGLNYLTLDRLSRTLSGGEAQRINLATSLGSSLVDTLYVLDEPSIGLHERDNQLLINILKELRDLGNTVVVVEHDAMMMRSADEILDLGPRAGEGGGRILFQGTSKQLLRSKESLTARYLREEEKIYLPRDPELRANPKKIVIQGAREHNLKEIDVEIPLGKFVVVTGVSGSGKSTLIYDCLYSNFLRQRGRPVQDVGAVKRITGLEHLADMILIDQSPVGRTPRSNPVTYLKAFDDIRRLFAATRDSKLRKLAAGDFSFNVPGGRCPACEGDGKIRVEMHFLADVFIECEACQGTRYQRHVLDVRYRDKNIHEVLSLTVDEAFLFFRTEMGLLSKLDILRKVGLGYLRLGQSAVTLSRGEAQRLKLAAEMMERGKGNILYIFDEPTTGLHYHDIQSLMDAFGELLARGNSLVVIEHNMELIKCADHLIDLGPEGGARGGKLVFQGLLRDVLKVSGSHTGQFLRPYL